MSKQLESSDIQRGACRYCGQIMEFETSGLALEADLNEWATEKCDCPGAKAYAKKKKSLEDAKEKIQSFFNQSGHELTNLMSHGADIVFAGKLDSFSINLGNGIKGKVTTNSKGNIVVEKTVTTVTKYEG